MIKALLLLILIALAIAGYVFAQVDPSMRWQLVFEYCLLQACFLVLVLVAATLLLRR